jgi:hypothetical protein
MPRNPLLLGRLASVALAMVLLAPAGASAQDAALNVRAGSLGVAGGLTLGVTDRLSVRADVPYFSYERSATEVIEDLTLEYEASADLFGVGGLVDWHPFGNTLRLSGGAYYNTNEVSIIGRSAGDYKVGSVTYKPEDIGELSGVITMGNQVAPYLGLGLGNPVKAGNGFGFTLDLGVLYMGSPKVELAGTEMLEPMSEEGPVIESNLSWAKWYPSVSLGLSVKLF